MTIDEIIDFVVGLDGVLTLRPGPGDGTPEISWGDAFFYYSPEGVVPERTQPFATVVTKNYPGDEESHLDRPNTYRLNIDVDRQTFTEWVGRAPREPAHEQTDPSAVDTVIAHPVYGSAGWLAVVNPGERTTAVTRDLLTSAYERARTRYEQRARSH